MWHTARGSCTHAGDGERTTLQGRAARLCPVPLAFLLLWEAGHVWLFTPGPPALPPVSLMWGGGPALAASQLQPPLSWSHHCWFFPSKEASCTTGRHLRICSWRLRKQLVSNRNSLSLMRFNKNLHLSTLPGHCHSRGHLWHVTHLSHFKLHTSHNHDLQKESSSEKSEHRLNSSLVGTYQQWASSVGCLPQSPRLLCKSKLDIIHSPGARTFPTQLRAQMQRQPRADSCLGTSVEEAHGKDARHAQHLE